MAEPEVPPPTPDANSPEVNYPRGQIDFPAEKYRELARLNLQLSVLSWAVLVMLFGVGWYVYSSLLRTGGPDAGSLPATLLKNFPVVFTTILGLVTFVFYRPLKRIAELMKWSIYTPAVVSVFTAIFLPTGLGLFFVKGVQVALKREFYKWRLPLAWLHYWPKFVDKRINRLAANINAENSRLSRPVVAPLVPLEPTELATDNLKNISEELGHELAQETTS